MKNGKILSVEWLRGIAALGVCIMHIFCALEYFRPDEYLYQKYVFPIAIIGRLGVPVFFVISGFILPYSMYKRKYQFKDFFNFLSRRLLRLEPPYLVSIILATLVAIIVTPVLSNTSYSIDWLQLTLHLGYLNVFTDKPWINPVYWTLAIEFQFYLLIGLVYPLLSRFHSKYGLEFFVLIALATFLNHKIDHSELIFKHIHLFILGGITFKKYIQKLHPLSFIILSTICLAFIFNIHAKAYAVFALLTSIIILKDININNSYLHRLGDLSYSLYLTHWFIGIELLRNLYVHYFPNASTISKLFIGFGICIICVIFSQLFYKWVEKPTMKLTRKFVPKRKQIEVENRQLEEVEL